MSISIQMGESPKPVCTISLASSSFSILKPLFIKNLRNSYCAFIGCNIKTDALAFSILSLIISAIRFIDIIISIIISPFVAISLVGDGDGVVNWCKDIFCIVFSQSVLILLLQLLLKIMADNQNLVGILLSIGCMAVMLRGPQVLRNYVYKTGTGGGVTGLASVVAMKSTVGSLKKP